MEVAPPGKHCIVQLPAQGCPSQKVAEGQLESLRHCAAKGATPGSAPPAAANGKCAYQTPSAVALGQEEKCGDGCVLQMNESPSVCLNLARGYYNWCGLHQVRALSIL